MSWSGTVQSKLRIGEAVRKSRTVLNMGEAVFTYCYEAVQGVNVGKEKKGRGKGSPL